MSDPVVLTGITPDWAVPGNYIQVNFAQGAASGSDVSYPILLIGNKTSAGSATADTQVYGPTSQVPMYTEADVIALFGTGSEIHAMWREIAPYNKTNAIYAIAVTESAGVAATAVVTFTSGPATAQGVVTVWVDEKFVQVTVNVGDSITTVAANVATAINQNTNWQVTAASALGVLTITCRNKGPRGNWHRFSAAITSNTGVSVDSGTVAYFTGGTTADSYTTALSTIDASRYYWIVSAAEDATNLGALSTQVTTQALPASGIRQRVFAGYNGTQANLITITTGLNNPRVEQIHMEQGDVPPLRMAARLCAIASIFEVKPRPRHNFNGFGNAVGENAIWDFPAPRSGYAPTATYLNTSLKSGITPVGVNPGGTTYIVKRCTTRFLNGSTADFRIRDPHKVTICDFFADDWQAKLNTQFAGMDLEDDPAQGAHVPGPGVATPNAIEGALVGLVDDYNGNDQLDGKNVATTKAGLVVQRSTMSPDRVVARAPLYPINILNSTLNAIDQDG